MPYINSAILAGMGSNKPLTFSYVTGVVTANKSKTEAIDSSKEYILVTESKVATSDVRNGLWYITNGQLIEKELHGQPATVTLSGNILTMVDTSSSANFAYTLIQVSQ